MVYACSDLHGCYGVYEKINSILNDDDIVIFIGDAGDRGPDSWKLITAIYENPQWFYLKGNHEDMLIRSMKEYRTKGRTGMNFVLLKHNEGDATFNSWRDKTGADYKWIDALDALPINYFYTNKQGEHIILNHGGAPIFESDEDIMWNRFYWYDIKDFPGYDKVVHGHTPIQIIKENFPSNEKPIDEVYPFWYGDNNEFCCIDSGCVFVNKAILLNLDDWSYQVIENA